MSECICHFLRERERKKRRKTQRTKGGMMRGQYEVMERSAVDS